jgi:hypothetical protein
MELGRSLIMKMSISYKRADAVMGIKITAIPGMSNVIHVVAKVALIAVGGATYNSLFRAHAAMEH